MGFEPTIDVATYNGLANRRLQPLGHPSTGAIKSCEPKRPHVMLKIHGVCSFFPTDDLSGCQIRKYPHSCRFDRLRRSKPCVTAKPAKKLDKSLAIWARPWPF